MLIVNQTIIRLSCCERESHKNKIETLIEIIAGLAIVGNFYLAQFLIGFEVGSHEPDLKGLLQPYSAWNDGHKNQGILSYHLISHIQTTMTSKVGWNMIYGIKSHEKRIETQTIRNQNLLYNLVSAS